MKKSKFIGVIFLSLLIPISSFGASIIATVGGNPITDTDITARTKLMARQGQNPTDNRKVALQSIIDDHIKLDYAANFKAIPSDKDVDSELKKMNLSDLSSTERAMAKNAIKANIAWQMVIGRTIMPTIEISDEDVSSERLSLERERGLPIDITMIRLLNIPEDVAKKLTKPSSCDGAIKMAQDMGGSPQKLTAAQYELSADIRQRIVGLPLLTWSSRMDGSVLLVCEKKKTSEYGKLDEIIKQNALYKKAMFAADQQLKQLRRKAVVVINDSKYKL